MRLADFITIIEELNAGKNDREMLMACVAAIEELHHIKVQIPDLPNGAQIKAEYDSLVSTKEIKEVIENLQKMDPAILDQAITDLADFRADAVTLPAITTVAGYPGNEVDTAGITWLLARNVTYVSGDFLNALQDTAVSTYYNEIAMFKLLITEAGVAARDAKTLADEAEGYKNEAAAIATRVLNAGTGAMDADTAFTNAAIAAANATDELIKVKDRKQAAETLKVLPDARAEQLLLAQMAKGNAVTFKRTAETEKEAAKRGLDASKDADKKMNEALRLFSVELEKVEEAAKEAREAAVIAKTDHEVAISVLKPLGIKEANEALKRVEAAAANAENELAKAEVVSTRVQALGLSTAFPVDIANITRELDATLVPEPELVAAVREVARFLAEANAQSDCLFRLLPRCVLEAKAQYDRGIVAWNDPGSAARVLSQREAAESLRLQTTAVQMGPLYSGQGAAITPQRHAQLNTASAPVVTEAATTLGPQVANSKPHL